ncbi:glycosyltransferase [Novosphingobium sp. NBM11]|uniref:glycosyltransferase n=1 Tax=Novosphingobium sp. NBM11 TaxID=2596914 RepID=UPI0018926EE4|nr:glycosyltransferase [Novosphingobium sp. NBM11]MBF5090888.1 glycosyltransferase [Novosphingobium sp. NBM11]
MMRIVIDLQAAQGPSRQRGIGRYAMALTRALARQRGEHEVFVALGDLLPETIAPVRAVLADLVPAENIVVWSAPGPVNAADPLNQARRENAELLRESALARVDPDFVIASSLFEGFSEDIVTSIGRLSTAIPTAAILYDLIPLIHRQVYLANPLIERWYENKLAHLRNADLLLAISESSRQEAIAWLASGADEVVNISTAADDHFTPAPVSADIRASLASTYGLDRAFVMYTGGIDHRKNIERLIQAFALLPEGVRTEHQLAIVCAVQESERVRLLKLARDEGLADGDVILTGFIPEEDLLACYRSCQLFVFPSWHEGFGLPALEAMKCGRAVIAADRSGLPEVVGLESALFDPFDVGAISAKMLQVLTDTDLRENLERHGLKQARKFSWDRTALRAWDALERAHAQRTQAQAYRAVINRPRLAFVSPVAPQASGISDYSAELLPELARHYRIDVVTPQGMSDNAWIRGNCGILDIEQFRRRANEFDRVLYHFGNSQFHAHMFDLLHDIPGVVVLHDFFLSGIIAHLDNAGDLPGVWPRALLASHGWPAVVERFKAADPDQVIWNYPCNLQVLQDALGVIVHADYSRQLARAWYGDRAAKDWRLIPHLRQPIAVDRTAARQDLGIAPDDFVVCSFGHIAQTKMNHVLLEAWLASPLARDPHCRLVFVGQSDGNRYTADLERLARSPAAGGRVEITGWADQSKFRRWLHATDLAVQLRTLSRGETSGTVLDCMNAGVATIVNAHGAMTELPRDTVCMLDDGFTAIDLSVALEALWRDVDQRAAIARQGKAYIAENHQPRACARRYHEAIEHFYARAGAGEHGLLRELAKKCCCRFTARLGCAGSSDRAKLARSPAAPTAVRRRDVPAGRRERQRK